MAVAEIKEGTQQDTTTKAGPTTAPSESTARAAGPTVSADVAERVLRAHTPRATDTDPRDFIFKENGKGSGRVFASVSVEPTNPPTPPAPGKESGPTVPPQQPTTASAPTVEMVTKVTLEQQVGGLKGQLGEALKSNQTAQGLENPEAPKRRGGGFLGGLGRAAGDIISGHPERAAGDVINSAQQEARRQAQGKINDVLTGKREDKRSDVDRGAFSIETDRRLTGTLVGLGSELVKDLDKQVGAIKDSSVPKSDWDPKLTEAQTTLDSIREITRHASQNKGVLNEEHDQAALETYLKLAPKYLGDMNKYPGSKNEGKDVQSLFSKDDQAKMAGAALEKITDIKAVLDANPNPTGNKDKDDMMAAARKYLSTPNKGLTPEEQLKSIKDDFRGSDARALGPMKELPLIEASMQVQAIAKVLIPEKLQ